MTLRELEEKLEIPHKVALRLAPMISGAKKEAAGPGQLPRWSLPDEALNQVTEEMLEEARKQTGVVVPTQTVSPAPPLPDPALADEELAVKREKLAAEKIRAETARLQAEAERKKVQEELKAMGATRGGADPILAERLGRLEQRLESALQRPDPTAAVAEMVKALTPLLERVTTPAPAPPAPSSTELLALFEKVKGLVSPEGNLRGEIRAAFREGLEIGRERATGGEGGGFSWTETIQGLLQGLAPTLPALVEAAKRSGLAMPASNTTALPSANPGGNGGSTVTEDPNVAAAQAAFKEVVDLFADEVKKPDRNLAGLAAFLESIVLDPVRGVTLLDRLVPMAQSPERLAQVSLKLFFPRLTEPDVWPGMQALLAHLRAEAEQAEKRGEPR